MQLPEEQSCVTVPKPKGVDEVSVYLRAISRGADVMKEILPMLEDLRAISEFLEESTTEVVLIAGKLHTEWKGAC